MQVALLGEMYNMDALERAAKAKIAASGKHLTTLIEKSGFKLQDVRMID